MSRMRLKDIAIEKNERVDNPSQSQYSIFVGLEHYDSGEATIRRYGSTERLESTMKVFHSGDILIARRNVYLKRAATVDFDGLTSGDSIVLHIENEAFRRIAPFVLNTDDFWIYANQHADGSMSKRLSPKLLMEYEFSLPDGNLEQVADILWAMERVKTAYRELIARTDDLVKSQFIEMFGTPESALDSSHTIAEVADVQVGIVIKPTRYYADGNSGIKAFRSLNIGPMCIKDDDWVCFTEEAMKETQRTIAHTDDILVVRSGNPGTSCVVPPEYDGCNVIDLIIAHPNKEKVLPEYLSAFTNMPHGMNQINSQQRGVAQKHFNVGMYKDLKLILPSLDEQKRFVEFLKQSDKSKFAGVNRNLSRCLSCLRKAMNTCR